MIAVSLLGVCALAILGPPVFGPELTPERPGVASARSASPDGDVTLFLIGDAGGPSPQDDPVLVALTKEAASSTAANRVIVFLGNNIYPRGMPDSLDRGRAQAVQRIDAELRVGVESGAQVIFVPGNQDWDPGRRDGWAAIRREETFIDHADCVVGPGPDMLCASMLPANGCPGPALVDVGLHVRLILLDTQWWLEPTPPTTGCPVATEQDVASLLQLEIAHAGDRRVVVAAHHPLVSGGAHGEPGRWRDPRTIPAALARHIVRNDQDFSGRRYRLLRAALDSAFASDPPFAFASGHDHGLQVISRAGSPVSLVSGAGTYHHLDRVERVRGTRYEAHASGYMRLDFLADGGVKLAVRVVDGAAEPRDAYTETWR